MLAFIYRAVLSLNATSWMLLIYGVKEGWAWFGLPKTVTTVLLFCIPIVLSLMSIGLSRWFRLSDDKISVCQEIQLADNEFLPVYLGYFFVALSVPDDYTIVLIYVIVLVFSFISQTQYFNPIFLLLGFHYYHVKTAQGTNIFIISYGKVIRGPKDIKFHSLKRINDTTFIAGKEKL